MNNDHVSENSEQLDIAFTKSTAIIRVVYSIFMAFAIIHYFIVFFVLLGYPDTLRQSALYCFILAVFSLSACYYFGWRHPSHWLSGLMLLVFGTLVIIQQWDYYFKNFGALVEFWPIGILSFHFGLVILFGGLFLPVHFGLLIRNFIKRMKVQKGSEFLRQFKEKPIQEGILLLIMFSSAFLLIGFETRSLSPIKTVEIEPEAYQMEFAFWAKLNYSVYTVEQKEALNRHNALLIPYDVYQWFEDGDYWQLLFIEWCQEWLDNYPNVKIMPVVHGIPGRFIWDGCAETSIRFALRILRTVDEYNFTNVIGLNTDQENADGVSDWDKLKSKERNDQATTLWDSFFATVEQLYPGRFEFQTTFGKSSMIDVFDEDRDLDIYVRNNAFTNEGYDEFAPMVYVGGGSNYESTILDANSYHYEMYREMQILQDTLTINEWESRIGVYIGITNMSIFGNLTKHTFNGVEGNGFDALVTQGLIAKHFECKRLTIFILSTEVSGDDPDDPLMGGCFDSYGDDFLDRYNASVNGVGSTDSFSLKVTEHNNFLDKVQLDFWFNWYTVFINIGLVIVCLLTQYHLHCKVR